MFDGDKKAEIRPNFPLCSFNIFPYLLFLILLLFQIVVVVGQQTGQFRFDPGNRTGAASVIEKKLGKSYVSYKSLLSCRLFGLCLLCKRKTKQT